MTAITACARLAALCASLVMAGSCWAADAYPNHKVRMIVPFAAGGPTDVIGRMVAERLSDVFGQQIYVEDLPGAGGNLGVETAARATPDGYTILVVSTGFIINPSMYTQDRLRPDQGFRADHAGRGLAQCRHGQSVGAGEDAQGADRSHQGQSRQIQLRPARHRLDAASRRRAVQADLRARHGDGAVQRRAACDQFDARQSHADCVYGVAAGHRHHQGRQPARHRDSRQAARRIAAGSADQYRRGRAGPGKRHLDRHSGAGRYAEGRSSTSGTPRSSRWSQTPRSKSASTRSGSFRSPIRPPNSPSASRPRWRAGPRW